jgi:HPt (histidine-containing phosphotransfer) domain-containing protein
MEKEPPLEKAETLARFMENATLLRERYLIYQHDAPKRVADLGTALQAGNWAAAAGEAHSIKSAAVMIGAVRVSKIAAEMEECLRARMVSSDDQPRDDTVDYSRINTLLARLRREMKRVHRAIARGTGCEEGRCHSERHPRNAPSVTPPRE